MPIKSISRRNYNSKQFSRKVNNSRIVSTKSFSYTGAVASAAPANVYITATGGTITTAGAWKIHEFTTSNTFSITSVATGPADNNIDVLVVAGGGGVGYGAIRGGGGAGGYLEGTLNATTALGSHTITVGGGGTGGIGPTSSGLQRGVSGTPSLIDFSVSGTPYQYIAIGGGGGGGNSPPGALTPGGNGGSGGMGYGGITSPGGSATQGPSSNPLGELVGYGNPGAGGTGPYSGGGGGAGSASTVVTSSRPSSQLIGGWYYAGEGKFWRGDQIKYASGGGGRSATPNGPGDISSGQTTFSNSGDGGFGPTSQLSTDGATGSSGKVKLQYLWRRPNVIATGGEIYSVGDFTFHKFRASNTFSIISAPPSMTYEYLIVAGGGGGGGTDGNGCGGGGAGGYKSFSNQPLPIGDYPITIGGGGAGGTGTGVSGSNGSPTTFNGITATGGGGGATQNLSLIHI